MHFCRTTSFCPRTSAFSPYISPIAHIASSFGLIQRQHADDTQLYIAISRNSFLTSIHQLEEGLSALYVRFSLNGLALNPYKSDAVHLGTWQRHRDLPSLQSVDVAGCVVPLSSQVKILGVTLDSHLTFNTHVVDSCTDCSFHMCALRRIRPCLTDDVATTIASALVSSQLDYTNTVLVGVSDKNITKLQRTQNTLARIVIRKYERRGVTQSLKYLHWLSIK